MTAKVRVTVEGDKELIADLKSMGDAGTKLGKSVIQKITLRTAGAAKMLSPMDDVDGGQLRNSIRISKPSASRRGVITGAVVAGGKPLEAVMGKRKANLYAVIQHDDMTLQHDDGQAKFVEVPAMQEFPKLPEELRDALDGRGGVDR